MSTTQALAIAAASLVMAGHPWSMKLAVAETEFMALRIEAEAVAQDVMIGAGASFRGSPDSDCMKRSYVVL